MIAGLSLSECSCGNIFGSFGPAAESNCQWPCPGNNADFCGGSQYNALYQLTSTPPTEQWVSRIIRYSSEWGGSWSASQVIGSPNVYPAYGDYGGAWSPSAARAGLEYLE